MDALRAGQGRGRYQELQSGSSWACSEVEQSNLTAACIHIYWPGNYQSLIKVKQPTRAKDRSLLIRADGKDVRSSIFRFKQETLSPYNFFHRTERSDPLSVIMMQTYSHQSFRELDAKSKLKRIYMLQAGI
jgi:hypothetical protein